VRKIGMKNETNGRKLRVIQREDERASEREIGWEKEGRGL